MLLQLAAQSSAPAAPTHKQSTAANVEAVTSHLARARSPRSPSRTQLAAGESPLVGRDRLASPPAKNDDSYSETFDSYTRTDDVSDKSDAATKKTDTKKHQGM